MTNYYNACRLLFTLIYTGDGFMFGTVSPEVQSYSLKSLF